MALVTVQGQIALGVPARDEIEVSIFGPGLGEAIAIHAGLGKWILVDSCFDDAGEPASLAYLLSLGIDPNDVVAVVASHWDDDHIGGMAQTLEACAEALFHCSDALATQEFLVLTEAIGRNSMIKRSGLTEFAAILGVLKTRQERKQRFPSPNFAIAGRPLWQRSSENGHPSASLRALSPSDGSVTLARRALAELIPGPDEPKRRVRSPDPNHTSVVLEFEAGDVRVLLGADLEKTADPTTGWVAILDGNHPPSGRASALKVPHHGSADSDEPRVWDELLEADSVAVLTPFVQGNVNLPRDTDRVRLLGRTPDVFTTSGKPRRRRRHDPAVERTLREAKMTLTEAEPPMGQVRLRRKQGAGKWTVDLFDPAARLKA